MAKALAVEDYGHAELMQASSGCSTSPNELPIDGQFSPVKSEHTANTGTGDSREKVQIKTESTSCSIGDAWSGVRGLLQEAYSTKVIKGILGKAGLTISEIKYSGTYKGPVLDGADKLVSWSTTIISGH